MQKVPITPPSEMREKLLTPSERRKLRRWKMVQMRIIYEMILTYQNKKKTKLRGDINIVVTIYYNKKLIMDGHYTEAQIT